ncbi:vegetative incompatibility protein het-e-1 [Ilyonectria robusta]
MNKRLATDRPPNPIICRKSNQLLISASWDRTIKLWDVTTGTCTATLEGHSNGVNPVVFAHNSTMLASASWDCTINGTSRRVPVRRRSRSARLSLV